MGLLKFLKEKFSKKNKENIENSPIEKNDSVDTSNEVKKDDVDVLNTKKSEVNKNENKVFEEKQIKKYEDGLEKSRKSFALKLKSLSKKYKKVNKEYFDNLEEVLIEADVGVRLTLSVIDELIEKARKEKISDADEINEALIDILFQKYVQDNKDIDLEIKFKENSPTICLVVGVNGVGKTTSIAKLANWYKNKGKKVLIIAADTFAAGDIVDVQGVSKGKGFQGVIKRWNQTRGPMGHGSQYHRGVGSLGTMLPMHVIKGKKLPGHMGSATRTVQNEEVVAVDMENNVILIKGNVPGPKKSFVIIKTAVKKGNTKATPIDLVVYNVEPENKEAETESSQEA